MKPKFLNSLYYNNHLFKPGDKNNIEIVCICHLCDTSVSIIVCCLYALLIRSFDQQVTCPCLSSSTCILHTQPPLRYHNYLLITSPLEVNLSLPVITCYVWLVLHTVLRFYKLMKQQVYQPHYIHKCVRSNTNVTRFLIFFYQKKRFFLLKAKYFDSYLSLKYVFYKEWKCE